MSLSLGIFIVILVFFAVRGYIKGFFGALGGIVSLITAYIAAFLFIKPAAKLLQEHTGLEGMLVYLIAGLIIFILVSLFVSLIFSSLNKLVNSQQGFSVASRIAGLCVGVLIGGIVGVAVIYGVSIAREITQSEAIATLTPLENTSRQLTGKMVAQATHYVYPEAREFSESFVVAPVAMSKSLQGVANNPDIKMLMSEDHYQQLLTQGDAQALIREPLFQRLMTDADVQYLVQQSQLTDEQQNSEEAIANAVIDSWQGFQAARNDIRVQNIMTDPEFQKKLHTGDKLALMNDPQLRELAEVFFQAVAENRASNPEQ